MLYRKGATKRPKYLVFIYLIITKITHIKIAKFSTEMKLPVTKDCESTKKCFLIFSNHIYF